MMTTAEIRSCEDALRLLAAHLDRELSTVAHAQVEQHLARCRSCYSRAEFESRLKASLAELGRAPVEPALAGRIRDLIGTFTVAGGE
jgi:predicted anti-sigma-YlaC factor YlaD